LQFIDAILGSIVLHYAAPHRYQFKKSSFKKLITRDFTVILGLILVAVEIWKCLILAWRICSRRVLVPGYFFALKDLSPRELGFRVIFGPRENLRHTRSSSQNKNKF
jgi:hypothetical protein